MTNKDTLKTQPLRLVVKKKDGSTFEAYALDVSNDGMRLVADQHLPKGEIVDLDVYLSLSDPFPIRVVGESLWSRELGDEPVLINLDLNRSHTNNLNALLRQVEIQKSLSEDKLHTL